MTGETVIALVGWLRFSIHMARVARHGPISVGTRMRIRISIGIGKTGYCFIGASMAVETYFIGNIRVVRLSFGNSLLEGCPL